MSHDNICKIPQPNVIASVSEAIHKRYRKFSKWIATLPLVDSNDNKYGFTLAEVLITLTIIGVIAAITIPNLMKKWEDAHTVSAVKEAYSILNNAIKMAVIANGPVEEWNWPDKTTNLINNQNANYIIDVLKPYMKFSKICYSSTGCMPNISVYKNLNGNNISYGYTDSFANGKAILSNGMAISFATYGNASSPTKTYWPSIRVDVNGKKGPNRYGYDVFYFRYFGDTNKLFGGQGGNSRETSLLCCLDFSQPDQGTACAYWILKHGNVDYKYRDVRTEW